MSRPWRDEVAIFLGPRRLALARRSGGPRPRVVATAEVALAEGPAGDPAPALARLGELLSDRAWHGGAARAVVADDPWARCRVVPWPAARLDADGRLAHARYALADAWGDGVADWAVTLADTPPGHPLVACATPAALRGDLEEVLAPARLVLVSLQPRLVAAFNAWRHRLPTDGGWFVTVDDASLSAVHLRRGEWDRVHQARLAPDWDAELERLKAAGGLDGADGRLFVDAPQRLRRAARADAAVEWLEGDDGDGGHDLALLRRLSS